MTTYSDDYAKTIPACIIKAAEKNGLEIKKEECKGPLFEYKFIKRFPEGYSYPLVSIPVQYINNPDNVDNKKVFIEPKDNMVEICTAILKDITAGNADYIKEAKDCARQMGCIVDCDESGIPYIRSETNNNKDYATLKEMSKTIEGAFASFFKDIVAFDKIVSVHS